MVVHGHGEAHVGLAGRASQAPLIGGLRGADDLTVR